MIHFVNAVPWKYAVRAYRIDFLCAVFFNFIGYGWKRTSRIDDIDNYNYRFDVLKDEKLEKAGEFKQKNPGFAEIEGYKDEKIIIRETEINDDGYIYFNRWTGESKETVFYSEIIFVQS